MFDEIRLAGGLDFEPVEASLELELTREGLALVGAGAQTVDLVAVLLSLPGVRTTAGRRIDRRDLGLGRTGGGGQAEGHRDQGADHISKMVADVPASKRGRNPGGRKPFSAVHPRSPTEERLMTRPTPDDPGYGRDENLEQARVRGRPAGADLDGDPAAAADDPLTVSPDPDAADDR